MKSLIRLGHGALLAILLAAPVLTHADGLLGDRPSFDPSDVPIYKSRIVRVPDERQEQALRAIGDKDFITAPADLLDQLLRAPVDMKQMLAAQAAAADSYAEKREAEAANPAFSSSQHWMLATAREHRAFSRYTRSLSPRLHAYLVRAKVYFEGTGGFVANLRGDHLSLMHGSLGRTTPPLRGVAVAIFLERPIKSASISAGIDE